MSRIPELKHERDKQIREAYTKIAGKMVGDKQLYRHEAILEMLSKKFYLGAATIGKILSDNESTPFVNPNQIKMFDEPEEKEQ